MNQLLIGAIPLPTKAVRSKLMRRLVSISVDYMLGEIYGITHKRRVLFLLVEHNRQDAYVLP